MADKNDNKQKTNIRKDTVKPIQKSRIHGNVTQESFDKPAIRDRMEPPPPPTPKKR